MKQAPASRLVSLLVLLLLLAISFQLRDRDFEFVLDPDFRSPTITSWLAYFQTWSLGALLQPEPHPYMDSPFMLYALASGALHALARHVPEIAGLMVNADSYNLAAVNLVNGIAYALAGWLFYGAASSIAASRLAGAATALLLVTAPSMLDIDFVRIDYLVLLPVVALFCGGLAIARGRETLPGAAVLGFALAFVATIKLNGVMFALFPAAGVAASFLARPANLPRLRKAEAAVFAASFAIAAVALLFRYWTKLEPVQVMQNFWQSVELVVRWTRLPSEEPAYYYHVTLLRAHGLAFIVLNLAAAALVCWRAFRVRDPVASYLALAFALFSLIALLGYKYPRGGYHLLPIFLANICLVTRSLAAQDRPLARLGLGACVVAIVLTLYHQALYYVDVVQAASQRAAVIDQTRRAPRAWLKAHVSGTTTVCILRESAWALPPLADLPVRVDTGPFDFPYLDTAAMARFSPPSVDAAQRACPIIILSDVHESVYNEVMRRVSPPRAAEWQAFYAELRAKHPPRVFKGDRPAFHVQRIEIFDLRK